MAKKKKEIEAPEKPEPQEKPEIKSEDPKQSSSDISDFAKHPKFDKSKTGEKPQ